MQTLVNSHLAFSLLPDRLPVTFLSRLNSWSNPDEPFTLSQIAWEPLKELLVTGFSPAPHSALLKTWVGLDHEPPPAHE
eukprot:9467538-Pyramimonas_sp.AAC.1